METKKDISPNTKEAGLKDSHIRQGDIMAKKTEKLVTAIFMVTDLMDKDEPIRHELRSASLKLLSDNYAFLVSRIMSMIGIATSIGLISDMNGGIISKELAKLGDSIPTLESLDFSIETFSRTPVRTAIQPGGLSQGHKDVLYKTPALSLSKNQTPKIPKTYVPTESKSDRRENILKLIKDKKEVTIKDISSSISGCSEKTIQRELISLLKDKIIQKTGEKRWSRYFI